MTLVLQSAELIVSLNTIAVTGFACRGNISVR
jgi:hypothetical protein